MKNEHIFKVEDMKARQRILENLLIAKMKKLDSIVEAIEDDA
jgi:hypothetical protein